MSYSQSEAVNEIAGALAKAQAEMKNPGLDSTNPHFRSGYVSLAGVRDAVVPCLAKHGISVVQALSSAERGIVCDTRLLHSSGQWISAVLELPVSKDDAQGAGSAATYARRYALMALVCVAGDEDDDGNEAAKAAPAPRQEQAPRKQQAKADNGRAPDGHKLVPEDEIAMAIDEATSETIVKGLKLEIGLHKGEARKRLIDRASAKLEKLANPSKLPADAEDLPAWAGGTPARDALSPPTEVERGGEEEGVR